MIKGRFLFLYHTDQRSSWDTGRCPCARIFPFITAVLTPLRAWQPLFPVHKGRCKLRLALGRPKLITGHSAGRQLIAESCRSLWEELQWLLFQHAGQRGGCIHFSIPKTVIGCWAFFHLQKHEGLMCCQVEQSCSMHKGVWMSPSDDFRWVWLSPSTLVCLWPPLKGRDCTYRWAVFRIQPSGSSCVFTSLSEHFQDFSGACSVRGNWKRQQVCSAVS